jgi:hypothetical protein
MSSLSTALPVSASTSCSRLVVVRLGGNLHLFVEDAVLLILDQEKEALKVADDSTGLDVETVEQGRRIKRAHARRAPDVVRALLAGRHPIALTPTRLLRLSKDLPHDWQEQRRFLGFAA